MKTLSDELKKGRHSAVIILERSEGREKIRGYISFKNGSVSEALYKKSLPDGTVEAKQGREALKNVWHEALNKLSKLRVYYIPSQEAGFTAHLTKPIDFAKLEAMIRQVAH